MLFKTVFFAGLAASALAATEAPVEARSVATDNGANRMVKIKRSQTHMVDDVAKRAVAESHAARERRSGAARMHKRHHGDPSKRDLKDNEKRELPLFQGLQALLQQTYPGLNQAVVGVENTATGAVNGLDGILKRDLNDNEKRELPLFQGLQALLQQAYPGLNQAVVGVENTATGAVNGLDGILKRDLNDNEKRELPLFQGLQALLQQTYPGLNQAVVGVENTATGAVNGLDGILKRDLNDNEKRELPLFQGLQALLQQTYPGLNQAVVGVENTATGAVNGLDGILKRDLNDNEKRELPLFQGLQALLQQTYPGLNQAVVGVENTATGAVNGLDGILKKRDTETPLLVGLQALLQKAYPGVNGAGLSAEALVNDLVGGLDKTLKKRDGSIAPSDNLALLQAVNRNLLYPLFNNLNGVVVNTEQAVDGTVDGVDGILKKRNATTIAPNSIDINIQLEQLLQNLLGGQGAVYNLLRGLGLSQ